jgi:hypothetical protein
VVVRSLQRLPTYPAASIFAEGRPVVRIHPAPPPVSRVLTSCPGNTPALVNLGASPYFQDRTLAVIGAVLFGMLLIPFRGDAQISPFQLEARGRAWIPTVDLAGATDFEGAASPDASFGVHFVLRGGMISYVVGFSEHRFGCEVAECGGAVDFVSTAWDLGVRLNLRQSGIVPWVGLGASAASNQATTPAGVTQASAGRSWGYEAGAGVLLPVGGAFALNPGVRYGKNDADFASRGRLETRYIVADVGFVLGF